MGKSKMDEAAAARIRKARGDKDEFARRAAMAARTNKEGETSKEGQQGGDPDNGAKQGEAKK